MEFEVSDLINKKNYTRRVTAAGGKVRVGSDPKADVYLDGPNVGPVLGLLENDGTGRGWQFFNFNGRPITVVDYVPDTDGRVREVKTATWLGVTGEEDGHVVFLKGRVVELRHPPDYLIKVRFEANELAATGDRVRQWDRQTAEFVIGLHRELNRILSGTGLASDSGVSRTEEVADLERRIGDLAGTRPEFPADDTRETPVGDHLAGAAVRAELIRKLGAQAGGQIQRLRAAEQVDSWAELRIRDDAGEKELTRMVTDATAGMGLDSAARDLTARMSCVKKDFWGWWTARLAGEHRDFGRQAPSPQVRRYLALRRARQEIKALWYGYGPLEDVLDDPTVTEIMVVDKDHIFVEKDSQIEDSGVRFLDDETTLAIMKKVATDAGRVFNEELPLLDAMMPDGSRVNAVYPTLALRGPALTVRRFPSKRITMKELVERHKSLSLAARNFLEAAVLNRRNILVSGGTGTGKTTLLNCLSGFIPSNERIITIEDTAELQLLDPEGKPKEHVVTLQTRKRTSNKQAAVEIDIRELVKNALRMRPDRIVVGECRGAEALDMLKAMNTGHDGSLTTLHANTTGDAILRLESMCLEANKELPVASIRQMIASAVDLVVQLRAVVIEVWDAEKNDGAGAWVRKKAKLVSEIAELEGVGDDGLIVVRHLFSRAVGGPLRPTGALPSFFPELLEDPKVRDILKSPLDLVRESAEVQL